jgi:hypothetical protein
LRFILAPEKPDEILLIKHAHSIAEVMCDGEDPMNISMSQLKLFWNIGSLKPLKDAKRTLTHCWIM